METTTQTAAAPVATRRSRRYVVTAMLLGIAWYAVVFVVTTSSMGDPMSEWGVPEHLLNVGCCVVASSAISIFDAGWIRRASGFRALLLGILLMYAGTIVTCVLWMPGFAALSAFRGSAVDLNLRLLFVLPALGCVMMTNMAIVTFPMGMAHVAILRWAGSPRNVPD